MISSHFLPYYSTNPYQALLIQALRNEGITVHTRSSLAELAKQPRDASTVVHLHWAQPAPLHPVKFLRWIQYCRRLDRARARAAFVLTAHNLVPHESKLPRMDFWLSRRLVRQADRIICHSNSARTEILNRLDANCSAKLRVVPHGHYIGSYPSTISRVAARQKLGLAADNIVFLLFGMIRAYKGTLEFIHAFRTIDAPGARLVIAGRPQPASTEKAVIEAIGGDSRILLFPHFIADADIQLYMNASDVAVFPYRKSLTSGALILAMSFGKACIAPRLSSIMETVAPEGALLYEPDSADGLSRAISDTLHRSDRLTEMGACNLRQAQQFDWESIGQATGVCYREALAEAHRRMSRS